MDYSCLLYPSCLSTRPFYPFTRVCVCAQGVTSLNEMAEKFLSQPSQRATLIREKGEAEARLHA